MRRWYALAVAARGKAKALQYFGIKLDDYRIGKFPQFHFLRPIVISLIPVAHVLMRFRHHVVKHAIVLGIHFPLLGIWFANQWLVAILAAPADQETLA